MRMLVMQIRKLYLHQRQSLMFRRLRLMLGSLTEATLMNLMIPCKFVISHNDDDVVMYNSVSVII